MTTKIKNWHNFQHYKNRRPPWIRLYRDILDDPEFYEISGDDFRSLVMLWLIASEDPELEGNLPDSKKLAFRLRVSEVEVLEILSRLNHWVISDASAMLAERKQVAIPDQIRSEGDQREIRSEHMISDSVALAATKKKKKSKSKYPPGYGTDVWNAYSEAYEDQYGTRPLRNAKQSSLCCQLRERLGEADSVEVARYYPQSRNGYHVARGHSLACLLADAEKVWTEWKTGNQITQSKAREEDKLQKEMDGWTKAIAEVCNES